MNQSVPVWYNSPKEIQRLPAGIEKVLQAKGERETCKSNLLLFWGPVQSALMSSGDSAPARMQGIPKDLDEAATIDGCSKYQIYSRIILPLMKPSIVTTVIIQFYWKWDDYMGPLLYLSRPQSYTVSIAIKLFADSASTTDYGAMFAMSTLSLIPVFLIFLFFNRYLVQGIGTSGLKG